MKSQPQPTPRRKWHPQRWLLLLAASLLAYAGWTTYAYHSALKEAKALGWAVEYTDPLKVIRQNWKAAFTKDVWLEGVTDIGIQGSDGLEQHQDIVRRLNPKMVLICDATNLRDLSALKGLQRLEGIFIQEGANLNNVDILKNLPVLKTVVFSYCTGLTNINALAHHSTLQFLSLSGCTGLTKESIEALKATLPKTQVLDNFTSDPEPPSP